MAAPRLQCKHVSLFVPKLSEVVSAVKTALEKNFAEVEVDIQPSVNLQEWCGLVEKGLGGRPRLCEVGGVPYMFDDDHQQTSFQIPKIVQCCGFESKTLAMGAGAASSQVVGNNAELVVNTLIPNGPICSRCACVKKQHSDSTNQKNDIMSDQSVPVVGLYPSEECGCLCNLFLCEGKQTPLLYIKVKKRTGEGNFTNTIREGFKNVVGCSGDKQIGAGGVFKVNKGKVRGHIMPSFPKGVDMNDGTAVDNWLNFYNFGPDLLFFSTLLTDDPTPDKRMHLRLEHTHFYSLKSGVNEGGHYHYDVTPDEIEYEGYFNLAECVYRIEDAADNLKSKL